MPKIKIRKADKTHLPLNRVNRTESLCGIKEESLVRGAKLSVTNYVVMVNCERCLEQRKEQVKQT